MRDTELFSSMVKPLRAVESPSNVERPLWKGKRNRALESVQLPQMKRDKILSEHKSLHEKEAERAYQGEFAAQT